MVGFIAGQVEKARATSLEKGQKMYRSYFCNKFTKKIYAEYKEGVDAILIQDDCEDCIVTE